MRFCVRDEVFDRFPSYCVGVVVAEGVDNTRVDGGIERLLRGAEAALRAPLNPEAVLEQPALTTWRAALKAVGIQPSRYRSSVEALVARTLRGDAVPSLSPLVNLANALSLTHLLPLGAHDLDRLAGDLSVGPLPSPLPFLPMGATEAEVVDAGEYVYADAEQVRTRRWIWRQSDVSKVTASTRAVVFPIDGWQDRTGEAVAAAMDALSSLLITHFGVTPRTWLIDAQRRTVDLRPAPVGLDRPVAVDGGFRMAGKGYLEGPVSTTTLPATAAVEAPVTPAAAVHDTVSDLLRRRVVEVVVRDQLEERLRRGDRLRVKFGIDPTGPQLHLGHAVPFRKLREFQELGHTICIVVGDFTAQIGDASDKTAQRQMLSEEAVYQNLASYRRQIAKVLDPDRVEWTYNNDWLGPLRFRDVVGLAAHFTVAQMLERENFAVRYAAARPIGLQELLYPLMQGYDSVALKADLELGGTEQLFNLLAGRTLQQAFGQAPQAVLTCPLLLGTDGLKMSKSAGNCIYLDEPAKDMYGKLMSITDEQILPYFELCTDVPLAEIEEIRHELDRGTNPMTFKKRLAYEVTSLYHPRAQALKAQQTFEQEVQRKELPDDIPEHLLPAPSDLPLPDLLLSLGLVGSKSEARRLILQHGVRLDGEVVQDSGPIAVRDGMLVQVGKRRFARLRLQS